MTYLEFKELCKQEISKNLFGTDIKYYIKILSHIEVPISPDRLKSHPILTDSTRQTLKSLLLHQLASFKHYQHFWFLVIVSILVLNTNNAVDFSHR